MSAGDERAFDEYFDAYFGALYRFARARLAGDDGAAQDVAQAAQDVAQAALARGARKIASFRGEAALLTWLCTICRRELVGYLRRNARGGQAVELREEAPLVRAALESLASEPPVGSEAALRRADLARAVQVTLDALPRRYGDALEWKYVLGLSVDEIAARLGLGPKAAESLLGRARQAFRDGFAAHGIEP